MPTVDSAAITRPVLDGELHLEGRLTGAHALMLQSRTRLKHGMVGMTDLRCQHSLPNLLELHRSHIISTWKTRVLMAGGNG